MRVPFNHFQEEIFWSTIQGTKFTLLTLKQFLFNKYVFFSKEIPGIIEKEFRLTSLSRDDVKKVMQKCIREECDSLVEKCYQSVQNFRKEPFKLAEIIRAHLIESGENIVDPYELELAIVELKNMPFSIYLGDTNYMRKGKSEDFEHVSYYFVIDSLLNLRICERDRLGYQFIKEASFQDLEFFYPKINRI